MPLMKPTMMHNPRAMSSFWMPSFCSARSRITMPKVTAKMGPYNPQGNQSLYQALAFFCILWDFYGFFLVFVFCIPFKRIGSTKVFRGRSIFFFVTLDNERLELFWSFCGAWMVLYNYLVKLLQRSFWKKNSLRSPDCFDLNSLRYRTIFQKDSSK